jgi:C_GCAxxG_C_C family probable redox protein
METTVDKAVNAFRSDFNCAQSVLTAFADKFNFDRNLALCISSGFGGGMGRLQKTCGAVTGAFMALGVYNCRKYYTNKERKEYTYAMIQEFNERFQELHGSCDCRTLLNCDLNTEEGKAFARENNLFEIRCEKYIENAISILEDMMEDDI